MPLGFSDKFFPYRAVLAGAIVCAGIWYFWVFELSGFYAAGGF